MLFRNKDCPDDYKCNMRKCKKICQFDTCGTNAECKFRNGRTICSCQPGYIGDPFIKCIKRDLCIPSPCGTNANCKIRRGKPVCSCLDGFHGDPFILCSKFMS